MPYTKVNLKQVEDSAPKFGYEGNHEARFSSKDLGLKKSGLSYQHLRPNKRIPFGHSHAKQEEVYIIISGNGKMKLGNEIIEVKPLDAIRVESATTRALAAGAKGLEFIVYGCPPTGLQDAKMKPDWWE